MALKLKHLELRPGDSGVGFGVHATLSLRVIVKGSPEPSSPLLVA